MIIGKGLIAGAFAKYSDCDDVVIFASGVSNSLEQDESAFLREQELLQQTVEQYPDAVLVYLGTCSVYDPVSLDTAYVQHKLRMEAMVQEAGTDYLVFRLPQVVGRSNNPATLLNYLYNNIAAGLCFDLWAGAVRYIVDIDDVVSFVSFVLDDARRINQVVNLVTRPCRVLEIVCCLEKIIGKKAVYTLKDTGVFYSIPMPDPALTVEKAGIALDGDYLERVLVKYYGETL